MIINKITMIIPTIIPPYTPNTTVFQKLKNTTRPKQKPVNGPPNLAQKFTTSIEFLAPIGALVTISPWMAAGVPPLCIDDDSFRGTVTDELNGRVFNNQEEYINQVIEFYENKKIIDAYSKQARVQAEHCSSRSYASSVLEVYQRALKEKKERTGIITKIVNFFKGE